MQNYKKEKFTYGCELEFADVCIDNKLPEECFWNTKDYSIVNSNGIANDPNGKFYKYGGEINTKPTKTIDEQIEVIKNVIEILNPKPIINYSCALHIHIGVQGLKDDIETCKKILRYIVEWQDLIFDITSPLKLPSESKLEKNRYKKNKMLRHYKLSEKLLNKVLNSTSPSEFYENHATRKIGGNLLWALSARPAINLRSLYKRGTIEFRHFFGTLSIEEYKSCFIWCSEILNSALNTNENPEIIFKKYNFKFPREKEYNENLDKLYHLTCNNAKERQKNILLISNKKI